MHLILAHLRIFYNDQALTALHYYLMYLKFGFGRAAQDQVLKLEEMQ